MLGWLFFFANGFAYGGGWFFIIFSGSHICIVFSACMVLRRWISVPAGRQVCWLIVELIDGLGSYLCLKE